MFQKRKVVLKRASHLSVWLNIVSPSLSFQKGLTGTILKHLSMTTFRRKTSAKRAVFQGLNSSNHVPWTGLTDCLWRSDLGFVLRGEVKRGCPAAPRPQSLDR